MIASFLHHNSIFSSKSESEAFITLGNGDLTGIWRFWGYVYWADLK